MSISLDCYEYLLRPAYIRLKDAAALTHKPDCDLPSDVWQGIGFLHHRLETHPRDVVDDQEGIDRILCYLFITCATAQERVSAVILDATMQTLETAHAKAGVPIARMDEFDRLCTVALDLHDRQWGTRSTEQLIQRLEQPADFYPPQTNVPMKI